jgi:hypothetical protein
VTSSTARGLPEASLAERATRLAAIALLGVFPVVVVGSLFTAAIRDDKVATDFGQFYGAAEGILSGDSPYMASASALTNWGGPYPYPPLPAELTAPLTLLSLHTAGLLVMASLVLVALAIPFVLGVRDWRCYGLLLLWPPVISAIQTGNVTLWFALAAALAWRFRDRLVAPAALIGFTLAVKFFLWPLVVWLAATRRAATAVLAVGVGIAGLGLSWAAIGFSGLTEYPELLRRLDRAVGEDSYTAYIVGLDAGLPPGLARTCWLALGLALLAAVVVAGRRGDDRSAFGLAVTASLALTPIVWLHYFALLVVPVALARPRLGLVWFVPLGMVLTPGSGHPMPFETAWTLVIAAITVGLALRNVRREDNARSAPGYGSSSPSATATTS